MIHYQHRLCVYRAFIKPCQYNETKPTYCINQGLLEPCHGHVSDQPNGDTHLLITSRGGPKAMRVHSISRKGAQHLIPVRCSLEAEAINTDFRDPEKKALSMPGVL